MGPKTSSVAALYLALMLGGCIPMEQSPLVYSSKQQFGVTVSAGTADSPGLDVNIGYKGLDAAFVPVAVAKHCFFDSANECKGSEQCDSNSPDECEDSMYAIQTMLGRSHVTEEATVDGQAVVRTREEIGRAGEERAGKQAQLSAANGSLERLQTKAAKEAELAALRNPSIDPATQMPRRLTDSEGEQLRQLQREVTELSALDEHTLNARSNTLKTEIAGIDQRLSDLRSQLEQQIAQRNEQDGNIKTDALSLFGSFNGSATGGSSGAGLQLGKVFATGIAAQNMAHGVADTAGTAHAASLSSRAECLDKATHMLAATPEGEQPALRKRLLLACGVAE